MATEKQAYQIKMDEAQLEAIKELKELYEHWEQDDHEEDWTVHGMEIVAEWMEKWYRKAGYKRLSKVLLMASREGFSILDTPELIQGE